MKRTLILTLFVLVTFLFAGCDIASDKKDDEVGTGTIEVTAIFNDSNAAYTLLATGTKEIYVYIYRSVPATGRSEFVKMVNTTSGGITFGTPYTITIDDLEEGDYYVMAMYDDKIHDSGANIPGQHDPYEFYSDAVNPTSATLAGVAEDSVNAISITFDDFNRFGNQAAFN